MADDLTQASPTPLAPQIYHKQEVLMEHAGLAIDTIALVNPVEGSPVAAVILTKPKSLNPRLPISSQRVTVSLVPRDGYEEENGTVYTGNDRDILMEAFMKSSAGSLRRQLSDIGIRSRNFSSFEEDVDLLEFLRKNAGISADRMRVTVFSGNPSDELRTLIDEPLSPEGYTIRKSSNESLTDTIGKLRTHQLVSHEICDLLEKYLLGVAASTSASLSHTKVLQFASTGQGR